MDSTSAELATAQHEAQARIAQLEQDLSEALQAMDTSEQASRVELDDATRRLEQVSAEKAELSAALRKAQAEAAAFDARLQDSSRETAQLEMLESQLHSAQREIEGLGELVSAEQEALKSQKEAVFKAESARDAAMRENKTLRALARSGEAEVEALKGENSRESIDALVIVSTLTLAHPGLDKVAAALELDNIALDTRLREIEETSQAHLSELIDTLQMAEERKAEVEHQVVDLEKQVKELEASLASRPDSAELDETIKELTRQLENKVNEAEESEERVYEALKTQKRSAASIERLKSKIAVLTRDLAASKAATAAAAPPSAPVTLAPEPTSTRKKRQAPSSDSEPTSHPPPRALVERPTRTPAKENDAVRPPRPLSAKKAVPVDMVVPLKEAAPSPPAAREVLAVKAQENGPVVSQGTSTEPLDKRAMLVVGLVLDSVDWALC